MNKSRALWAVLLFVSVDVVLFRLPVYCQFVKPTSFTGALMQRCQLASEKEKESAPLVALVGDSRMREGFSAKIFDEIASAQSLPDRALNLTVSGSTLRVWYYLLKHVDPNCLAFKEIVVGLPSFFDEDYSAELTNADLDLQLSLPILKATDTPEFVQSFEDTNVRNNVLLGTLLKSYGYRRDLKNFAFNISGRLAERSDAARYWEKSDYLYAGDNNSLAGIKIAEQNKLASVPPHLEQAKVDRLKATIFPGPINPDFYKRHYMQYWLDHLAQRYAGSATKIVLVCIPNKPLPVQSARPHINTTLSELKKYPNVCIIPESAFSSLNHPENFCDDIHLNAEGRRKFSQMLSQKLLDPSLLLARSAGNPTQ